MSEQIEGAREGLTNRRAATRPRVHAYVAWRSRGPRLAIQTLTEGVRHTGYILCGTG